MSSGEGEAVIDSTVIPVSAGDYFELMALQGSGGSLNFRGVQTRCAFAMEIVE